MWRRYRQHFEDREAKERLFEAIDTLLMRSLPDMVFCVATGDPNQFGRDALQLPWNNNLLPQQAAPHLLRQWIRDREFTQDFLTALLSHFERIADEQSAERRKILIATNALSIGFKPLKQAEKLMRQGNFFIPKQEDLQETDKFQHRVAATIGRFTGRLRHEARVTMQTVRPRLATGVKPRPKPKKAKGLGANIPDNRTQPGLSRTADVRETQLDRELVGSCSQSNLISQIRTHS